MMNIESKYAKAFCEVNIIINSLTDDLYKKIPKKFIQLIQENMDENYKVTKQDLKKNGIMPETEAIISLIYRDFFCDEKTRINLINNDRLEIERYNKIFENNDNKSETVEMTVVKEKRWYQNLFHKIKKLILKMRGAKNER